MKQGEHPPKGLKEHVLRLAADNPRPTNREIQDDIRRKFGTTIDGRTITRYCAAAGFPTRRGMSSATRPSREVIGEIRRLAKTIERQLSVPKPGIPLLDLSEEALRELEQGMSAAMMKGNATPWFQAIATLNHPWWRADGPIDVFFNLSRQQQALLHTFLALHMSQQLKAGIERWAEGASHYLATTRGEALPEEVDIAYQDALVCSERAVQELWSTVGNLRWNEAESYG